MREALPDALAQRVGRLGANTKIMTLETPGGQVWLAFDPADRRCVVTGISDDPSTLSAKLLTIYEGERSPWHAVKSADKTKQFEWNVRATARFGLPAVRLRAIIDIPDLAGAQIVLVTQVVH